MKKVLFLLSVALMFVGILVLVPPNQAYAATYVVDLSQFSTPQEKINHLRGILVVLQARLAAIQADQPTDSSGLTSVTNRNALTVTTLSAQDVRESKAEIRGRFDIDDEDFVMAWFEFGETKELYERTQKVRIEGGQEETRIHYQILENLKDDKTYYYRLVVENERGTRSYGVVRSFKTVDENRAYIVRARDTRVKIGETIIVDWFLPAKAINGRNWVGIFEVDSPHSISAAYSWANTETGSLSLYAGKEQDYEARLFTNDSYNLVAVSELITVSD